MLPTLVPGDVLLVEPGIYRRRPPVLGEIVVAVDPELPGRLLVKRVGALGLGGTARLVPDDPELPAYLAEGTAFLVSDNRRAGRDSRNFGAVAFDQLVGPAWHRVRPRDRAGPL